MSCASKQGMMVLLYVDLHRGQVLRNESCHRANRTFMTVGKAPRGTRA